MLLCNCVLNNIIIMHIKNQNSFDSTYFFFIFFLNVAANMYLPTYHANVKLENLVKIAISKLNKY